MAKNNAANQAAANAAAQAAAEAAAKEARRAEIRAKIDEACRQRDLNENYYVNALNAIYQLETAANGFEFMNGKQKEMTSDRIENAIYPNNDDLSQGLVIKDQSCSSNVNDVITTLYQKQSVYKGKYEEYCDQITTLKSSLNSI